MTTSQERNNWFLIKKPCFLYTHPNFTDLVTNKNEFFKNSNVLDVGISNHHSFIVTVLKKKLTKSDTKIKFYRDCIAPFKWKFLKQS